MIKIVKGDILQASEDIIGHQVNCQGVMGAGLAKQIRNKYPHVYDEYRKLCLSTENKYSLLGEIQIIKTDINSMFGQRIVNIFAQYKYGRNKIQTDYDALRSGLEKINALRQSKSMYNSSIALPYGIGCGLAGGDWTVVYRMIDEIFDEVTLYKL